MWPLGGAPDWKFWNCAIFWVSEARLSTLIIGRSRRRASVSKFRIFVAKNSRCLNKHRYNMQPRSQLAAGGRARAPPLHPRFKPPSRHGSPRYHVFTAFSKTLPLQYRSGLEFSKISKYRKYHEICDIFDIFQTMKICNKLL